MVNDYPKATLKEYGYHDFKVLKFIWKIIKIILVTFSVVMLYISIVIIAIQSFNSSASTTEFTGFTFQNYIDKQTGTKSVSGEIIEITDLDNRQSAVIDSTVTDNYFYKENYVVKSVSYPISEFSVYNQPTDVSLVSSDSSLSPSTVTMVRNKYDDGFVYYKTGYIVFRTSTDAESYDTLRIIIEGTYCDVPIKSLKGNHQYMVIIKYGDKYPNGNGSPDLQDITFPYLVDYEDAYHWVKGDTADNIPFPNSIMIPHIGRIDKGDTLTATYTTSEQYKAFTGVDADGNHYMRVGNTQITEAQLQQLLALLG